MKKRCIVKKKDESHEILPAQLACTELYLRKCNRANIANGRPDIVQQKHFSSPVCNTLFWRRYAGSATTTVAANLFPPCPVRLSSTAT